MVAKTDPIAVACLQLAASASTMRAAAKMYLKLAAQTEFSDHRNAFLQCAAFYAQLAEEFTDDEQPSSKIKTMN